MEIRAKKNISFINTIPESNAYWDLYQAIGWNSTYNFTRQELTDTLNCSWFACSMYDSDKLVGFSRIIGDGILHAFIVDFIIHPDYQGQGHGSQLLKILLNRCKENNIRSIQLFAAKDKYGFYEKYGFKLSPLDTPGMQLNSYI